jgi:prolyl-tRNA editing enzyme YbaK/EbsC (Cys-tRNA(Pro) deacylase)
MTDPDEALAARVAALEHQIHALQANFDVGAAPPGVARVAAALRGVAGAALFRVAEGYYSLPLAARARQLGCGASALCKTLAFDVAGAHRLGAARTILVIVRYVDRVDAAALARALAPRGGAPPSLALAADGAARCGFAHNAVAPFGAAIDAPLVVSAAAAAEDFVWVGGGDELVKARLFSAPLRAAAALIADVTVPRGAEEE